MKYFLVAVKLESRELYQLRIATNNGFSHHGSWFMAMQLTVSLARSDDKTLTMCTLLAPV